MNSMKAHPLVFDSAFAVAVGEGFGVSNRTIGVSPIVARLSAVLNRSEEGRERTTRFEMSLNFLDGDFER